MRTLEGEVLPAYVLGGAWMSCYNGTVGSNIFSSSMTPPGFHGEEEAVIPKETERA
jgi:hypothetical protein